MQAGSKDAMLGVPLGRAVTIVEVPEGSGTANAFATHLFSRYHSLAGFTVFTTASLFLRYSSSVSHVQLGLMHLASQGHSLSGRASRPIA